MLAAQKQAQTLLCAAFEAIVGQKRDDVCIEVESKGGGCELSGVRPRFHLT